MSDVVGAAQVAEMDAAGIQMLLDVGTTIAGIGVGQLEAAADAIRPGGFQGGGLPGQGFLDDPYLSIIAL